MVIAFAAGVLSLALIRQQDFVDRSQQQGQQPSPESSEEPAVSG
jgi:hypothetical protein